MRPVDLEAFMERLANAASDAVLPFFRTSIGMEDKNAGGSMRFDPVTAADRAAEVAMRQLISQTFPTHGIVGEEFGTEQPDAEYTWVLDPIDGTRAFVTGLLAWGTLIGLCRNGSPVSGLMSQPFTRERFTGDGAQARYRGPHGERRLRTRGCTRIEDAVISTTNPKIIEGADAQAYNAIEARAKMARYGGDCYAYCMLAAGHIDAVIETKLQPYDIVALVPIVEGAGGVVTDWNGGPAAPGGRIVAAGDKRLHAQLLEELAKAG